MIPLIMIAVVLVLLFLVTEAQTHVLNGRKQAKRTRSESAGDRAESVDLDASDRVDEELSDALTQVANARSVLDRCNAVLEAEAAAISQVKVTFDFADAVHLMRDAPGKIITTGIGKAGLVAKKFATILSSTGTAAFFVHPAEAAHGDMGMVGEGDVVLAFSTSGKSREVIQFCQQARLLDVDAVIGVTSHLDSALRHEADVVINMGVIKEPGPLGLAPSASIAAMSAISDALALSLCELKVQAKEFGHREYALRHNGGHLGQVARKESQNKISA